MKIELQGVHLELTPAVHKYVNEKFSALEKIVSKWDINNSLDLKIEIGRTTSHHHKGEVYMAHAHISLPSKHIQAEKYDADIYGAIDGLKDILKGEIVEYKEKHVSHQRK